jgi:hypothetical protein
MRGPTRAAPGPSTAPPRACAAALACVALGLALGLLPSRASAQDDGAAAEAPGSTPPTVDPLLVELAETTAPFASHHRAHLDIQASFLGAEQSAYYELRVEPSRCYAFVAVGAAELADVDLHVYAGGVAVAADTDAGSTAVVHWCNQVFTQLSVEVRAYQGAGRFLFQVLAREDAPTAVAARLGARLDALSERFAEGYRPALSPHTGVLASGEQAHLELLLAAGRAYVIIAVGVESVGDLDLVLLDAQGLTELDADLDGHAEPVVRYRVDEGAGGPHRLRIVMVEGYGEYALGVYSD